VESAAVPQFLFDSNMMIPRPATKADASRSSLKSAKRDGNSCSRSEAEDLDQQYKSFQGASLLKETSSPGIRREVQRGDPLLRPALTVSSPSSSSFSSAPPAGQPAPPASAIPDSLRALTLDLQSQNCASINPALMSPISNIHNQLKEDMAHLLQIHSKNREHEGILFKDAVNINLRNCFSILRTVPKLFSD
jgi:hypothetical protein